MFEDAVDQIEAARETYHRLTEQLRELGGVIDPDEAEWFRTYHPGWDLGAHIGASLSLDGWFDQLSEGMK